VRKKIYNEAIRDLMKILVNVGGEDDDRSEGEEPEMAGVSGDLDLPPLDGGKLAKSAPHKKGAE
jgi:hypothetical protein